MVDKIFGKYPVDGIEIRDKSIAQAVSLKAILVPHTFGRHTRRVLGKTQINIVERLANKLMRGGTGQKTSGKVIRTKGQMQGKKLRALKIVEEALDTVAAEMKVNPIQALIEAVQNSAPREDTTRVSYGGVSYQVAVDISATRRMDMALRNISLAALMGSFNKPKSLSQSLASEIMFTAKGDIQNSYAMKKRDETERMARSAR